MTLFPFLCFSVIFCALVMVASGGAGGGKNKIVPALLIAAEVYLLLLYEGILGSPFGDEDTLRTILCSVVAIAALVDFMRLSDKAFPLLAVWTTLVQLLAALDVLGGVSL